MDEHLLVVEFMYGPADGATVSVSCEQLRRGELVEVRRSYHIYCSMIPWNGVATWIKLYDRGHVPVGVP